MKITVNIAETTVDFFKSCKIIRTGLDSYCISIPFNNTPELEKAFLNTGITVKKPTGTFLSDFGVILSRELKLLPK